MEVEHRGTAHQVIHMPPTPYGDQRMGNSAWPIVTARLRARDTAYRVKLLGSSYVALGAWEAQAVAWVSRLVRQPQVCTTGNKKRIWEKEQMWS